VASVAVFYIGKSGSLNIPVGIILILLKPFIALKAKIKIILKVIIIAA